MIEQRAILRMIRAHHLLEPKRGACSVPPRGARGGGVEFEHFDHGADVGVRGFGATPAEAFEGAARALFLLLCEDLSEVRGQIEEPIACDAATLEELLVA